MKLSSRASALTAELLRQEPRFAPAASAVEGVIAGRQGGAPRLPPELVDIRREVTAALWAKGEAEWSRRAAAQLALLRRLPPEPGLVLAFLELFAADFSHRVLRSGLDAAGVLFPGSLILDGAVIEGHLRLDGARCLASVSARGVRVSGHLSADQARFTGPARFSETRVERSARFAHAEFQSDANFDGFDVQREMWMRHAKFGAAFSMAQAALRHDSSFGAAYAGSARFDRTHFADTVSFENAVIHGRLSLVGCRFDGAVLANDAQPLGGVDAENAVFRFGVRPAVDWLRRGPTVRDLIAAVQKSVAP